MYIAALVIAIFRLAYLHVPAILCVLITGQDCHQRVNLSYREQK